MSFYSLLGQKLLSLRLRHQTLPGSKNGAELSIGLGRRLDPALMRRGVLVLSQLFRDRVRADALEPGEHAVVVGEALGRDGLDHIPMLDDATCLETEQVTHMMRFQNRFWLVRRSLCLQGRMVSS